VNGVIAAQSFRFGRVPGGENEFRVTGTTSTCAWSMVISAFAVDNRAIRRGVHRRRLTARTGTAAGFPSQQPWKA
jgi:hypothetical protein